MGRRAVLRGLGGLAGMAASGAAAQTFVCVPTAPEMAGPFPANGTLARRSNSRLNVLTETGILRSDIRPSLGALTPVAQGTRFNVELDLVDVADGCTPVAGLAVYIWQCDAAGRYSMYEDTDRNYLRGVAVSDAAGKVRFTSIYPGCYSSRWPHIHFQVFASAEAAVSGAPALLTSQLALPEVASVATYAADPIYAVSARNMGRQNFSRDMIWRDNTDAQKDQIMMRVSGDPASETTGTCTIALSL